MKWETTKLLEGIRLLERLTIAVEKMVEQNEAFIKLVSSK